MSKKKQDMKLQNKVEEVRFFYNLIIEHVIPRNPTTRLDEDDKKTDEEWAKEYSDALAETLQDLLEEQNYQLVLDERSKIVAVEGQPLVSHIPFLISRIYEYESEVNNSPELVAMDEDLFLWAQNNFSEGVYDTLSTEVSIERLDYETAVVREYGVETYYEGELVLRKVFTEEEIKENEGVRGALEAFYEKVEIFLEEYSFAVSEMPSSYKRSENNEYVFGLYHERVIWFSESEIDCPECYAFAGSLPEDIQSCWAGFNDVKEHEINISLACALEECCLPDIDVISYSMHYVDDAESLYDVCSRNVVVTPDNAEPFSMIRHSSELDFFRKDQMPTVELDINSISEEGPVYGDLVARVLALAAKSSPKLKATIYLYEGGSYNFARPTWSAFFGVAGDKKVLDILLRGLLAAGIKSVRLSDYISPRDSRRRFHVQDGYVWRPDEGSIWRAESL